MRQVCLHILAALASIAPTSALADGGPRVAIVVGNDAAASRRPLRFAKSDARRMREVLETLGHVDTAHLLLDREAADLDDLLSRIEQDLRAAGGGTVLFYYSGHADDRALLMGGSRYRFSYLRARLGALPARLYVAMLDACQSGAATRAKGGEAVPLVDLRVYDPTDAFQGGVFVTSSAAGELSHESDQLEASFFTHFLIAGLRGAADSSGDGRISLEEAYRYAYRATVSRTQGSLHGTQHPTVDVDVAGRGQVILTWLGQRLAYLVLPARAAGTYLVRAQGGDGFIGEIDKAEGRAVRLALGAGAYDVSVVQDGMRWHQTVELESQRTTVVDPENMRSAPLAVYTSKGGDEPADVFRIDYQLRPGFLLDASPSQGLRAAYLRHLGRWEIGLAAGWGQSSYVREDEVAVRLAQVGLSVVADARWQLLRWATFTSGADAGVDWLVQQGDSRGLVQTRTAIVFPIAARLGVEVPIVAGLSASVMGRAGVALFRQEGRLRGPFDGGLLAGVRIAL